MYPVDVVVWLWKVWRAQYYPFWVWSQEGRELVQRIDDEDLGGIQRLQLTVCIRAGTDAGLHPSIKRV